MRVTAAPAGMARFSAPASNPVFSLLWRARKALLNLRTQLPLLTATPRISSLSRRATRAVPTGLSKATRFRLPDNRKSLRVDPSTPTASAQDDIWGDRIPQSFRFPNIDDRTGLRSGNTRQKYEGPGLLPALLPPPHPLHHLSAMPYRSHLTARTDPGGSRYYEASTAPLPTQPKPPFATNQILPPPVLRFSWVNTSAASAIADKPCTLSLISPGQGERIEEEAISYSGCYSRRCLRLRNFFAPLLKLTSIRWSCRSSCTCSRCRCVP